MKKNGPAFEANGIGDAVGDFTKDLENIVEIQTDPLDWWQGLVELVVGPNHGLRIGLISSIDGELVEVVGVLPHALKKGLRRYTPWHDREFCIEWLTRPDGKGARYELDGLADLLGRLAERRELMQEGAK